MQLNPRPRSERAKGKGTQDMSHAQIRGFRSKPGLCLHRQHRSVWDGQGRHCGQGAGTVVTLLASKCPGRADLMLWAGSGAGASPLAYSHCGQSSRSCSAGFRAVGQEPEAAAGRVAACWSLAWPALSSAQQGPSPSVPPAVTTQCSSYHRDTPWPWRPSSPGTVLPTGRGSRKHGACAGGRALLS